MKKILLTIILGMFLFTCVSAESIGTFKVNTEVQLTNFCSTADCTYANLTQITYPNGTIENMNNEMTKEGNTFNYSYTPTELGEYYFITCSNPNGIANCDKDSFEVTKKGIDLNESETKYNLSGIFFLAIFGIVFISLGLYFMNSYSLWTRWLGFFGLCIGLVVFYYDLSLVTMYMEATALSGSSVNGVFIMIARFIKLLPYITSLVVVFSIIKIFRNAVKRKKNHDGWDDNLF